MTTEKARARGLVHELAVSIDTTGQMRRRSIRMLPGGDYGFAWNPHGTYARDLLLFVDVLGFTPMETLVAATRCGGEIMGRPDALGEIKPGYLADLLRVDGDPLTDIKRLQSQDALPIIKRLQSQDALLIIKRLQSQDALPAGRLKAESRRPPRLIPRRA